MAETNLDFLVNVDIAGIPESSDVKNLNTVLLIFGDEAGSDAADTVKTYDDPTDAYATYSATARALIQQTLKQERVQRVKVYAIDNDDSLGDILDQDTGWFAAVLCDDEAVVSDIATDLKGAPYLLAYGVEEDGNAPADLDDTIGNLFVFADESDEDAYMLAACTMAKGLAFDPDKTQIQLDWQNLTGVYPSEYDTSQRTNLMDKHYNLYGKHHGLNIVADGVNTKGQPFVAVMSKFWAEARIREAVSDYQYAIVNQYGISPYDGDGINGFVGTIMGVCENGERIGHFLKEKSKVIAPLLKDVTKTDLEEGGLTINVDLFQRWRVNNIHIRGVIHATAGE